MKIWVPSKNGIMCPTLLKKSKFVLTSILTFSGGGQEQFQAKLQRYTNFKANPYNFYITTIQYDNIL